MLDFDSFSFPDAGQNSKPPFIYYKDNHVGCYVGVDNRRSYYIGVYDHASMYFFKKHNHNQACIVQALGKEFNICPRKHDIYIPVEDFLSRLPSSQLGCLLLHQDSLLRGTVACYVAQRATIVVRR